jgi:hypothetical protein
MLFVFLEHVLGLCFYVGLIIFKNPLVEEGSIQIRIVLSFLQRSHPMDVQYLARRMHYGHPGDGA